MWLMMGKTSFSFWYFLPKSKYLLNSILLVPEIVDFCLEKRV